MLGNIKFRNQTADVHLKEIFYIHFKHTKNYPIVKVLLTPFFHHINVKRHVSRKIKNSFVEGMGPRACLKHIL